MGSTLAFKSVFVSFFALFIIFSFIPNAYSYEGDEGIDPTLPGVYSQFTEYGEVLSNEEARSEYLKSEWKKILNNSKIGPVILSIDKGLTFLNPVFKIVMGVEYMVSWVFVFTLILYIVLIKIGFDLASILRVLSEGRVSKTLSYTISAFFLILISTIRLPRFIAQGAVLFIYSPGFSLKGAIGMLIFLGIFVAEVYILKVRASLKEVKKERKIENLVKETNRQKKKMESRDRERIAEQISKDTEEDEGIPDDE